MAFPIPARARVMIRAVPLFMNPPIKVQIAFHATPAMNTLQ
jgi:hypothetical protein